MVKKQEESPILFFKEVYCEIYDRKIYMALGPKEAYRQFVENKYKIK